MSFSNTNMNNGACETKQKHFYDLGSGTRNVVLIMFATVIVLLSRSRLIKIKCHHSTFFYGCNIDCEMAGRAERQGIKLCYT